MGFLFGRIYVLETFLEKSSTFFNIVFGGILKEMPSGKLIYAMVIVRRVSLEVINFWELSSKSNTIQTFGKLLELLSVVIFYAKLKPEISDGLVSFDRVICL